MIITGEQLRNELEDLGADVRILDSLYFCPAIAWVRKFGLWLKFHNELYTREKWDCDDFALFAKCIASKSCLEASAIKDAAGAFGFCTLDDCHTLGIGGGGHARNIVRTSDAGLIYFEPQNALDAPVSECRDDGPSFVLV